MDSTISVRCSIPIMDPHAAETIELTDRRHTVAVHLNDGLLDVLAGDTRRTGSLGDRA